MSLFASTLGASTSGASTSGNSTLGTLGRSFVLPYKYSHDFEAGDVIYRDIDTLIIGMFYKHYGVYIGDDEVIDYVVDERDWTGHVRKISLGEFAKGYKCNVYNYWFLRRSNNDTKNRAIEYYDGRDEDFWREYKLRSRDCGDFVDHCALKYYNFI